ncbi:coenzyme F420-0:L-glutamate ligase [Aestuariicella hydrocarbonica]|uniref:Coenzyme F420-0:L-glutamate ligase n=1 Tax=Pseudomaricurvus hydrocarbonicus TaxID=1470433 RepID=A0A9E5JSR9_9GAMM|nr:coenzyme F420-0:L-glutamate ligase [Aestuariicella hydrocarbonica]NHO65879.1 coenzyme F420-0:L-glutamate ligase [Aestuariicella hydrocarbonica]
MPTAKMTALAEIPEIQSGDCLGDIIATALCANNFTLTPSTILVIAQKIISKAEGRSVKLTDIKASHQAEELAEKTAKDPRKVEMILRESDAIVRVREADANGRGSVIITRTHAGFVCANAGIDESNLEEGHLLLLPVDADRSAQQLAEDLETKLGVKPGVVITDTFGRPWRNGLVNVAIGTAGVPPIVDQCGETDAWGRTLSVTQPAFADELAAASGLLMGKADRTPIIIFEGLDWQPRQAGIHELVRNQKEDLFA